MEWLDLQGSLIGSIPPELGNLSRLRTLELNGGLTGPIPPELGNLSNLGRLELRWNNLTGSLPTELGNLSKLTVLWVQANELTGPIPRSFLSLPLKQFYWRHPAEDGSPCPPGTSEFVEWLHTMAPADRSSGPFCNDPDQAVLGTFFRATDGEGWTETAGWLDGPVLEEWHGVSTDSLGHVTTLRLSNNGLSGVLPDLGPLTRLKELRLDGNPLGGRLPLSLTQLPLEEFHYGGTDLCAPANDSFQAWLAGIARHEGTGIECEPLTDRDVLTALYHATDGPNWWNNDSWLSGGLLRHWNGVTTDRSDRVVELRLNSNRLRGAIPLELEGLSSVRVLDLSWNGLDGAVPQELGNLSNLETLDLHENNLTGSIPPDLGNLYHLQTLSLGRNHLAGAIPTELGSLSRLFRLELGGNQLSGAIPSELGHVPYLWYLDLASNNLSGAIPPELGGLANLHSLWLHDNQLSGAIPPELGGLANLHSLWLHDNQLSGTIPAELGALTNLRDLDLSRNGGLAGPLPESLTDLRLESLRVSGTDLCMPRRPPFLAWAEAIEGLWIGRCGTMAAYLTQAVQSHGHPVPLVADESALLRVFVTAARATTEGLPPVRARFFEDGIERHVVDIPGKSTPIPEEVDEGDLSKSQNAEVPGSVVQPGLEVVVEIDPGGTLDPGLGVPSRIPEEGRLSVEVHRVPSLSITMIPFVSGDGSPNDSAVVQQGREVASDPGGHGLLEETRVLLPVADIEVTAHRRHRGDGA